MKAKKALGAVAACACVAAVALPATASAHTTISALQPQGSLLTSARTSYLVRSPNETPTQSTWKIVMYVPGPVQTAISVKQMPDWKIRLRTVNTGQNDADGNPVVGITRISWTAKTRADEVPPHFFQEWAVRFQNPAFATKLCFGFSQYYTNAKTGKHKNPEIVNWTGAADSEHPSSCLNIVAS